MDIIAELWPYVALAGRFGEDSGDGDNDKIDFIEDVIKRWDKDLVKIIRINTPLDFSYYVERKNDQLIINRGTEGNDAWKSNFSPFPLKKNHMHHDFYKSGTELYENIKPLIKKDKILKIGGHSRGGPNTLIEALHIQKDLNIIPNIVTYCSPPLFTKKGLDIINDTNIPCIRVVNPGDIVDNTVDIILYHYGKTITLPKIGFYHYIPILRFFFGHAYSAVFTSMIKYYKQKRWLEEIDYLKSRRWVAKI